MNFCLVDKSIMMNEPRKKCAQGFFKIRVLSYVITQPASCCFILSLFLIAIELIALGIYVAKKDHMPDLDAMKVNNKPEASSYHELSLQIIHLFHIAIDRLSSPSVIIMMHSCQLLEIEYRDNLCAKNF